MVGLWRFDTTAAARIPLAGLFCLLWDDKLDRLRAEGQGLPAARDQALQVGPGVSSIRGNRRRKCSHALIGQVVFQPGQGKEQVAGKVGRVLECAHGLGPTDTLSARLALDQ